MLVRPKLEYASPIWNPHTCSQINRLERIQHCAARFVANDHRRTTSPTTLVLTLNWQTLERRRTIKQAIFVTFYKILNNIIEINPHTGLLTRSHNRHHFTIPRSRLNTVVYSFYPRAIRIWNKIPKEITEIKQPESFHAAISKLPFTTPTRDLARNEEFSEIAVINIFFTVLKKKKKLSVGGGGSCGENVEISHAIDM